MRRIYLSRNATTDLALTDGLNNACQGTGAPMALTGRQRNYGREHENICKRPRARSEGTN